MALAETANLIVNLGLRGNFARDMGKATRSLDTFAKGESRAFRAGAQIGTGIRNAGKIAAVGIAAVTSQVALGLDSLIKLEKATVQTEAVIKSTGGTAGVTADQVRNLAEKYEALNATIGDEVIQSGQNLLLTFTAVTKDAFEPALQAALDLSVAMGTDLDTAIRTVGKALSEPDKAMARLRRQGIILTKAEEKQVKAHLKNNDTLKAQNVILEALDKRYGGSFLAGGTTTAAKVAKFGDAIEDLQRTLAVALLPTVSNVADSLSEFFSDPAVQKGAEDLGREIGNLFSKDNIRDGIDVLRGAFQTAREVAPIVAAAAKTMGGFISTAVKAFKSLPPEIQNLAIAGFAVNKLTGGLVTNIGGGLISAVLRQLKSAVVTVHGGVVNVSGPGVMGDVGKGAPAAATGGSKVGSVLKVLGALTVIGTGVSLSADSIAGFAQKNTEMAQKGLTAAERQAQNYYTADKASQQTIIKRLGFQPSRADFDSGNAKLAGKVDAGAKRTSAAAIEAGVKAKNAGMETKEQIASSAMIQQALLGAQMATTRVTAYATQGAVRNVAPPIVGAIRANRPVVTTIVNVTATHVTKQTTIQNRYGPGNGSSGRDQRSGELEF